MSDTITVLYPDGQVQSFPVDRTPDWCPHCQRYTRPKVLVAAMPALKYRARRDVMAICQCSDSFCANVFAATYAVIAQDGQDTGALMVHAPLSFLEVPKFSETISALSPTFCGTYDEAVQAHENGLIQICGAGFRKALEFLVKDYAVSKVPQEKSDIRDKIARTLLGKCIEEYLPTGPIQEAAKRAAWLGNDETHYYRTWTERDINDLIALIQLTVKWIDFTIELEHYVGAMPDNRR